MCPIWRVQRPPRPQLKTCVCVCVCVCEWGRSQKSVLEINVCMCVCVCTDVFKISSQRLISVYIFFFPASLVLISPFVYQSPLSVRLWQTSFHLRSPFVLNWTVLKLFCPLVCASECHLNTHPLEFINLSVN